MKFFERVATFAIFFGVAAASILNNKYLPPNFAALGAVRSNQYHHYHGTASRLNHNSGQQYQYPAAVATTMLAHQIPILRNEYSSDDNGNYNFGFETGNGIKRDESGHFQGSGTKDSLRVAGSYSYTGDDGKLYSINYKADSNGFHAEGDHLPTPPPIPREIQETLHLHTPTGSQRTLFSSHSSDSHHETSRAQVAIPNALPPNGNYLPPHKSQGYNYDRNY